MHCRNYLPAPTTRRDFLRRTSQGFGAIALAALLADQGALAARPAEDGRAGDDPFAARRGHHRARARNVIFLYMDGGVSQVDSFDPKPLLAREHGKPFSARMEPTQFNNIGTVLKSPWEFQRRGQSGIEVSELFPRIGDEIDDIAVIRSMVAPFSEHNTANFFLHTGSGMQGRPSMGAWVTYGLGSECRDLPGYVVLDGGLVPSGGVDNFGSSFLPATYQASIFRTGDRPLANIRPLESSERLQRAKIALLRELDGQASEELRNAGAVESAIANYEMAFRMQAAVPELVDVAGETASTRALYGLDAEYPHTRSYGLQCLIARRLVERGVRFIELTCPRIAGNDRWDAHSNLVKNHGDNARAIDQPVAGLIRDLRDRGLLDETLIVWTGEFGRTPFAQGSDGRDHSPFGFSLWLAGGGVKGGTVYGATDEFGYRTIEGRAEIHDLHATMLHLLGLDHERLTYRFSGRDMRLTDVKGEIIEPVLA